MLSFHDVLKQSKSDDEALESLIKLGLVENVRKKTLRGSEAAIERAFRNSHNENSAPVELRDQVNKDLSDAKEAAFTQQVETKDSPLLKQMNEVNSAGETVLLAAFKRGFIKCVVLLLHNNADHQVLDNDKHDLLFHVREKLKEHDFFTQDLDTISYFEVLNLLNASEDLVNFLSDISSQAPSRNSSIISNRSLMPADMSAYAQFVEREDELDDLAETDYGSSDQNSQSAESGKPTPVQAQNGSSTPIHTASKPPSHGRSKSVLFLAPAKVPQHRSSFALVSRNQFSAHQQFQSDSNINGSARRGTVVYKGNALTALVDENKADASKRDSLCSLASTASTTGLPTFIAIQFSLLGKRIDASSAPPQEDGSANPPTLTGTPVAGRKSPTT